MRDTDEIIAIGEKIKPLLAGHPPEIQGAVLADLLAMWLAGHGYVGDEKASAKVREKILAMHIKVVRSLIKPNWKLHIEPQIKAKQH